MGDYFASGTLRDELVMLEICQLYGWTYQEYYQQPDWFVRLAIQKLGIERKKANAAH